MDINKRRVLVIGKKRSGLSAGALLTRLGATVYIYDDFDFSNTSFIDIENVKDVVSDIDFAVISPSIGESNRAVQILRARDVEILSELDLAYMVSNCKIIGITGTNGKTTSVLLTEHILKKMGYNAIAVGNVGIPFCDYADSLSEKDIAVVEASSFQLEQSICFSADVSAITNFSPDHLNRHFNPLNYFAIKTKLFSMQDENGKSVINYDDKVLTSIKTRNKPFYYSLTKQVDYGLQMDECAVSEVCLGEKTPIVDIRKTQIKQGYNIQNLMCALGSIENLVGLEGNVSEYLSGFNYPRFRNEYMGRVNKKAVYNDSKSTNTGSTMASVNSQSGKILLILGGQSKGEDYTEMIIATNKNVAKYYLVGENAIDIYFTGKLLGIEEKMKLCATLDSCVKEAIEEDIDVILFSPAAASFDLYKNYVERGLAFEKLIKKYSET